MEKLTLITSPHSRGSIVRWMLEETGAPYETKVLIQDTLHQDKAFLTLNPMGKVPVLQHGNLVVTEAAAICMYLADLFPTLNLAPNLTNRSDYNRWFMFAAGPLEAAITNNMLNFKVPKELEKSVGYGSYNRVINVLEQFLSTHDFVSENRFTAADVYLGSQVGFGLQFGLIEKRPAFESYWERLSVRAAFIRAQQLDAKLS